MLALLLACCFEFVNGFHDTANAVATVIYTNTLRPVPAVIWSGLCNFAGVFFGGIAVALSIIYLLPTELLTHSNSGAGLAMVFALLLSAILWNVGTWYLGLPSSSSHTLIGAILGVGLANGLGNGASLAQSVHWGKAAEIGLSLVISPVVGFVATAVLILLARRFVRNPSLYLPPPDNTPPPLWIRGILVVTCSGVSFTHGSNDGQKGVGLIMLILIGLAPSTFALNLETTPAALNNARAALVDMRDGLEKHTEQADGAAKALIAKALGEVGTLRAALGQHASLRALDEKSRQQVRGSVLVLEETRKQLIAQQPTLFEKWDDAALKEQSLALRALSEYAPTWVFLMVALSLGLGTMIGWKRIVVTVGERIGKQHLTYAQGAAAELVAMTTIGVAAFIGAPVSTTHVLSSGIAGGMAAQRAGVQKGTVRKILLAWVLTLPVSMALAAGLFVLLRWILD